MEEALYEIGPLRQFSVLSLLEAIPDEISLINFRHLLERPGLAGQMLMGVLRRPKNAAQLNRLFALSNLWVASRMLTMTA